MLDEDDVLGWINCSANNGSTINVNLTISPPIENKVEVWGAITSSLGKHPEIFGEKIPMNRRATDRIEYIDQYSGVTEDERDMLLWKTSI